MIGNGWGSAISKPKAQKASLGEPADVLRDTPPPPLYEFPGSRVASLALFRFVARRNATKNANMLLHAYVPIGRWGLLVEKHSCGWRKGTSSTGASAYKRI